MEALPFWCDISGPKSSSGKLIWRRGGLADNQFVRHRLEERVVTLSPLRLEEQMNGPFGKELYRLPHRRQRRPDDFGHGRIVEASDGDGGRDFQPRPMQ